MKTNTTKTLPPSPPTKKIFIPVPSVIHARAKASAAMQGKELQEWGAEAVAEKLAREEKARAS